MKVKLIAALAASVVAATANVSPMASAAVAQAAKCVITGPGGGPCPKLGSYYPKPGDVQFPRGPGYTTSIVYDVVTDYSPQRPNSVPTAFLVEARATAQRKITISCVVNGHHLVPADTHMNLYLNGTDLGYVPGYKSTCGDDPHYKVILKAGQSTNFYVEFHFTPHPGYAISISQLKFSTKVFRPFGSRVKLPYESDGRGSLSKRHVKTDIRYVKSFLTGVTRAIGNDVDSLGLTKDQWQALAQLAIEVPRCLISLRKPPFVPDGSCWDAFPNFLDFDAAPVT